MPSPKWKLVVDIGDVEETVSVPIASAAAGLANSAGDPESVADRFEDVKEPAVHPSAVGSAEGSVIDERSTQHIPQVAAAAVAASANASLPTPAINHTVAGQAPVAHAAASSAAAAAQGAEVRDPRVDAVVALLGEFMPSDPQSPMNPYLQGFMSLRLLLLRPSRSTDDEELMRTMLDSYSSYSAGGRQRSDIAVMLARDFMFLHSQSQARQQQQQQQQQPSMLSLENSMMQGAAHAPHMAAQSNSTGLSLFGLPSTSSSLQNSPALAPIPLPGNHDSMSIVSN